MRAVQIQEFGGPEVLQMQDVPAPAAEAGSVLIDVDTAGVNYGDVLVRRGEYMGRDALPTIPGWEVVGHRLADGARVVALLAGSGYAERVAAPQKDVVVIPPDISDHVALAMVIQGATAWHLLEVPWTVVAGETLLITGAGSGVTHLVIQLARLRGAGRTVVTASSAEKAERVLALGADAVVRTDQTDDLLASTRAVVDAVGADLLIDLVGDPVFSTMMRCLKPGGRAVVYGAAGGQPASVNTGALLRFGLTVSGLWLGHGGVEPLSVTLDRLFDLCRSGAIVPTLGPVLGLDDAATAHRLVEAREAVGKVALAVRR